MTKHTEGPWFTWEGGVYAGRPEVKKPGELRGYDAKICEIDDMDGTVRSRKANARLIAAAPDLLEALQEIMPFTATSAIGCHGEKCREPWCHSCNGEEEAEAAAQKGCDAWAKARAAIARATGEQP